MFPCSFPSNPDHKRPFFAYLNAEMIFFLLSCLSFILISKSFSHKPPPPWRGEMRLLAPWFWDGLASSLVSWFHKSRLAISSLHVPEIMTLKKANLGLNVDDSSEEEEDEEGVSLLDLPELTLEQILQRLSPAGLCSVGGVCTSLREKCRSDHFWKKHMEAKWGRLIGDVAYREWQLDLALSSRRCLSDQSNKKGFFGSLRGLWPFPFLRADMFGAKEPPTPLPVGSIMAWYVSLETGKFWFPAQVYNRENGHVGFILSCYDADLSYDSYTDTFRARYSPHERQTIEENIGWDRLRAAPVDTPAHTLHVSDCLNDLKPGDHIEIQWRRNREFPYGWWYGMVCHAESCDSNENHCQCLYNEKVILEFNQYQPGSRWRRTALDRKEHREEGNDVDGFYGGIRKLHEEGDISRWRCFRPTQMLE